MVPATDPVREGRDPHIVLGIVADPGAAFSLARELADTGLDSELDLRLPGARWCIEVELAWLTYSLAMIGGALGAALEPDEAVRAAAYVQHFDKRTRSKERRDSCTASEVVRGRET